LHDTPGRIRSMGSLRELFAHLLAGHFDAEYRTGRWS
jgi:hypothetical protein